MKNGEGKGGKRYSDMTGFNPLRFSKVKKNDRTNSRGVSLSPQKISLDWKNQE